MKSFCSHKYCYEYARVCRDRLGAISLQGKECLRSLSPALLVGNRDQASARQSHVPLSYGSSGHDPSHPCIISEPCEGKVHKSYSSEKQLNKTGSYREPQLTQTPPGVRQSQLCHVQTCAAADPGRGGESKFTARNLGKTRGEDTHLQLNHCSAARKSYSQITHFLFFFLTRRFWLVQKRL